MRFSGRLTLLSLVLACSLIVPALVRVSAGGPRVIDILADKDNRFKVAGEKKPVITVKAGEVIQLRITARKGTEQGQDGAIHGFAIKELKDQGWDLRLKPGTQVFTLAAPDRPGEYDIECTVYCGPGHNEMKMKLVVTP
jgi:heme/copper-type cytochrome/quinol oxidase subunit 2